jgi:uncharacterized protein
MKQMSKTILQSKDSKLLFVADSGIHNNGIFAFTNIQRGTRIIEYKGEKITKDVALERAERDLKNGTVYIFELDETYDIDGWVNGSDAIYINHSCSPNAKVDIIDGKIWIVALKDIMQSEEIAYDYGFDLDEGTLKHPCRCGAKNCRGYIIKSDHYEKLIEMLNKIKP